MMLVEVIITIMQVFILLNQATFWMPSVPNVLIQVYIFFPLVKMWKGNHGKLFLIICLLPIVTLSAIISSNSSIQQADSPQNAVFFTIVTNITDLSTSSSVLSQMATPGFSRKHGFNHIALDGWSCNRAYGLPISVWQKPTTYLNNSFAVTDSESRKILKQFYEASNVKLLVNAFGRYENPISQKLNAAECAGKLLNFIDSNNLDGASIDFQDEASFSNGGLEWITQFSLALSSTNKTNRYIFAHTVDVSLFDESKYPVGDYSLIQRAVGRSIDFYNIRFLSQASNFTSFKEIFTTNALSVSRIEQKGVALSKIVIAKPSLYNSTGYVRPSKLINYYRRANAELGWWGGVMFWPFIHQESEDQTRLVTLRRDNIQPIAATNLDSVNFWWPPEKTAADMGVPGYALNNMYNTFILGTWTCRSGPFDISLLWSKASFYLSNKFGNSTEEIQSFLKRKYESKGKKVLVRAFGNAESPTSGKLDPNTCARSLALFVKSNGLDGVDVNYQDNIAFNNGVAENWLITFANALRSLLPFHIVSHSIQDYLLDKSKYSGGSYSRVISTVGHLLDYYSILYYGQQHTAFATYQQLFLDSGAELANISVTQLVALGFDINKIVIGKPTRLYDAQGVGFLQPQKLRQIFLKANQNLGWGAGIAFSSYINDQNGASLLMLMRGINRTSSKRFVYVDNVKTWWPPQATLGQMGAPTLAAPNIYNYFAYSFWTCGSGPQGISKLYNDPVKYLGTDLGNDKSQIQSYIKSLYSNASVKLLISAFGASEFPVNASLNAVECGKKMAQFMNDNLIDGIDIDFEDSQSFQEGVGEEWVNVFMRQVRKEKPFHIITHAPQAPYFDPRYAQSGSYLTINQVSGKFIDFYNVQFYNQGNTTYSTYQGLFLDSGAANSNTSVFQIISQGIEAEKVVLGKPASQVDAYNTGYVSSSTLKALLKRAVSDPNNPGWIPSVMFWQYLSDLNGTIVADAMNYLP